jgi:hypothetical protein
LTLYINYKASLKYKLRQISGFENFATINYISLLYSEFQSDFKKIFANHNLSDKTIRIEYEKLKKSYKRIEYINKYDIEIKLTKADLEEAFPLI